MPPTKVAVLVLGLRENSRLKMKLRGETFTQDTLLMAAVVDRLSFLVWAKTKDAEHNRNRPASIVETLTQQKKESNIMVFDSPEAFEKTRKALINE